MDVARNILAQSPVGQLRFRPVVALSLVQPTNRAHFRRIRHNVYLLHIHVHDFDGVNNKSWNPTKKTRFNEILPRMAVRTFERRLRLYTYTPVL